MKTINSSVIVPRNFTGLEYEYEYQVLARTSAGDRQQRTVEAERTFEDGKKTGLPL